MKVCYIILTSLDFTRVVIYYFAFLASKMMNFVYNGSVSIFSPSGRNLYKSSFNKWLQHKKHELQKLNFSCCGSSG